MFEVLDCEVCEVTLPSPPPPFHTVFFGRKSLLSVHTSPKILLRFVAQTVPALVIGSSCSQLLCPFDTLPPLRAFVVTLNTFLLPETTCCYILMYVLHQLQNTDSPFIIILNLLCCVILCVCGPHMYVCEWLKTGWMISTHPFKFTLHPFHFLVPALCPERLTRVDWKRGPCPLVYNWDPIVGHSSKGQRQHQGWVWVFISPFFLCMPCWGSLSSRKAVVSVCADLSPVPSPRLPITLLSNLSLGFFGFRSKKFSCC